MLPFDHNHLTETERACERMMRKPNCWSCSHLRRYSRSGYRGCDLNHDIHPVVAGEVECEEHEAK